TSSLILAGGFGANGAVMEVEKLDLSTATWSTVVNLTEARAHHAAAASGDDVLFVGGVTVDPHGNLATLDDGDFLSAANGTMQTFKMAQGRNGCAAVTLQNGTILVTGGYQGGTKGILGLDGTSVGTTEIFTKP